MLQEIYNRLDKVQLGIIIFWTLCMVSFWVVYVKCIFNIIQDKYFNTQK